VPLPAQQGPVAVPHIFDRALSVALQRLDELADIADSRHQLAALIAHQVRTVSNESSLGMTSWFYKWFDPAHDDPDEIAGTMIQLVLGDDADADSALARLPAPTSGLSADLSPRSVVARPSALSNTRSTDLSGELSVQALTGASFVDILPTRWMNKFI
jgi:hypothetical protein